MNLDVDALLGKLENWVATQDQAHVRLVKDKPMTDAQIDEIPSLLEQFPYALPTPYDPKRFIIPDGYRALLTRAGGIRLEARKDANDGFEPWDLFNIIRPGSCKHALQDRGLTLCDSWSDGASIDGREITTTELVSFATAGYSGEPSYWCFNTAKAPHAIYEESNGYECLAGRYVDNGEPISTFYKPVFESFEAWLMTVIAEITATDLDLDEPDKLVRRIIERGESA